MDVELADAEHQGWIDGGHIAARREWHIDGPTAEGSAGR
jgi:hypothetical protein